MSLPEPRHLIFLLNVLAFFNTCVVVYFFLRRQKGYSPSYNFLVIFLFCTGVVNFMIFLIESHYILYVPWLLRLPSPLYYLMFPSAYLYLRMTVRDEYKPSRWDGLHFVPAVLHFIEMIPYYLKSNEEKTRHVSEMIQNPLGSYTHDEGILPPYLHNIIRGVQGICYGLAMLWVLRQALKSRRSVVGEFPHLLKWLRTFSLMILLFGLSIVITLAGQWATGAIRSLNLAFWAAVTQGVTTLTLILDPDLLLGMPRLTLEGDRRKTDGRDRMRSDEKMVTLSMPETPPSVREAEGRVTRAVAAESKADPEWIDKYRILIEEFRVNSKSYLKQHYTIGEMSGELGIPQHHLSYILNAVYKTRFNDFVNQLRIDHIRAAILKDDALRSMTMEGLAKEAGFASRMTFISAVKRIKGLSPTEYFRGSPTSPDLIKSDKGEDGLT